MKNDIAAGIAAVIVAALLHSFCTLSHIEPETGAAEFPRNKCLRINILSARNSLQGRAKDRQLARSLFVCPMFDPKIAATDYIFPSRSNMTMINNTVPMPPLG